jgi:inosine/xanthosine triphosphate pyrophosphatase family protein
MNQTPILLATTNPDKQQQFRWLLEGLPLTPVTPQDLGLTSVPDEVGDSHHAVARLKAQLWSQSGSILAIASDGGLVLPALGAGWESLYTHRFAGETATGEDRVRNLLEMLRPYRGQDRRALWLESLAIAHRGRILASWELDGATGRIGEAMPSETPEPDGFWAFSVWEFPKLGKTYNQLSIQERESLDDHWVRLTRLVRRFFRGYFVAPTA